MKRRSFLASVVAGLVAPFLPKITNNAERRQEADDWYEQWGKRILDVQTVEDNCLACEFDSGADLGLGWSGSISGWYEPDPEHPGKFLVHFWECNTCGLEIRDERLANEFSRCLTSS